MGDGETVCRNLEHVQGRGRLLVGLEQNVMDQGNLVPNRAVLVEFKRKRHDTSVADQARRADAIRLRDEVKSPTFVVGPPTAGVGAAVEE